MLKLIRVLCGALKNLTKPYNLHQLCKNPSSSIVQIEECLIENVDIDELDESGNNPLLHAVKARATDIVDYLIQCGANPNTPSSQSFPPLVIAASQNDINTVDVLLNSARIDINQNHIGCTAVYVASQLGLDDILDLLLSYKADVLLCKSDNQISPLHVAALNGHVSTVKKLCQIAPALINHLSSDPWAPLHVAVLKDFPPVVEVLLEQGANPEVLDSLGHTPLYQALLKKQTGTVRMLLEKGADYQFQPMENGRKLYMLAKAGCMENMELVELLLSYPHPRKILASSLHDVMIRYYGCKKLNSRRTLHAISEKIRQVLVQEPPLKILGAAEAKPLTWEEAYEELFINPPTEKDINPENKDAMLRHAVCSLLQMFSDPELCKPYLIFLSEQLEHHWKKENGSDFPAFDPAMVDLWEHEGMLWPAPNEKYNNFKRFHMLDRIILDKFKHHDMGEKSGKWTGFVPQEISSPLLTNNTFFTENRKTINGLFHGNVHNIQRFIGLCAMEGGKIPLSCKSEGNFIEVTPKEVFSALHRTDLWPYSLPHPPLWIKVLDHTSELTTFSHPQRFQSVLLTDENFKSTLQDYLRFSFCNEFLSFVICKIMCMEPL